jgi:molybdopterin-biosynthesis enzyme MoeA-like protein
MDGVAGAFGRLVRRHAELESTLRQYYSPELVDGNLRMADIPEGARLVHAKGLWFPVIAVENVYIFPGVPEILRRKFDHIKEMFREEPFHLREVFLRADEGQIAPILHHVLAQFPELLLGSYPAFDNPGYSIKLTLESKDFSYLDRAYSMLLVELSKIQLAPIRPVGTAP